MQRPFSTASSRPFVRPSGLPASGPLVAGLLSAGAAAFWLSAAGGALAAPPGGPPPVGVDEVRSEAVTGQNEYLGRIQAIDRVALVARVTAYLEKRLFREGSEVKKGDLLYVLEQGPFQAAVLAQRGNLAEAQANVRNASVNFRRQQALLNTPAGQKQAYDNAQAQQGANAGQVLTAEGDLQSAEINLAYTEIRAPVDGRISETSVNEGNVVTPSSGTLATIVTQDPMYVEFSVATRDVASMRKRFGANGGLAAARIRIHFADGSTYDQDAHLDYVSPIVTRQTDTLTLRGTVANPIRGGDPGSGITNRELVDGQFVTVTVEDPKPVVSLVIPRAAVLSDQQGDYVFSVDGQNKVHRTNVKLGQIVGADAVVTSGLQDHQKIVVDGVQRVHDGQAVSPQAPQPVIRDPGETRTEPADAKAAGGGGAAGNPGGGTQAAGAQGSPSPAPGGTPSRN
ncbi:efflux RND transporter periplasmic adaptor subunit [Rhizosaccharibacter radicis]|uniref:Efflux RND transporter periplasmic adaptor subunit n=1 Tax=Rhizosaccharibacter radicis TaxID=2782605 RepID=A0ABT1VUE8_9PROT|nr:efflux RND transporter periplasmic adaptor subunit [Acetobacteraceae bacterium KSS12]